MRQSNPFSRRGITLLELLVVIGIISVLASILLPVVSRVRRAARSVQCLANLREIESAYQTYVMANDGVSLYYMHDLQPHQGSGFWMTQLRPLYAHTDSVRFCPEALDTSGHWGGAMIAWGPMDFTSDLAGSYAFNGWNHRIRDRKGADITFSGGPPAAYVKFTGDRASQTPVFGDAVWPDAWPRSTDPAPGNLSDGDERNQGKPPTENMMARFCIARHGQSINLVYLDGHAENVQLADLWHQHWSNGFTPTYVTLPAQ